MGTGSTVVAGNRPPRAAREQGDRRHSSGSTGCRRPIHAGPRRDAPKNQLLRVLRAQFNLSSYKHARANSLLRRRVDEDVKRRQLTVLRYTNVSASKPLRVIGRSIRPRKETDAMHRLPWPTDREHLVFKLREKELNNGVNLFDALMNAAWIDKDAILIPQFVDCRATAVRVSSVEDLQQVPFNDLLD
jgi:hypothetical protein